MLDFIKPSLPIKKPVDKTKAYQRSIYTSPKIDGSKGFGATINGNVIQKDLAVIEDVLNNKIYGEKSQAEFTDYFSNQIKTLQRAISQFDKTGIYDTQRNVNPAIQDDFVGLASFIDKRNSLTPTQQAAAGKAYREDLVTQLTTSQSELDRFQNNYVQHEQVLGSFDRNTDDWNKYFEANYKNPRIVEGQKERAQQLAQDDTLEIRANKNLKTPKDVGTGVSSVSPGNPFGNISSGLNI